jgi:hypothetical protein
MSESMLSGIVRVAGGTGFVATHDGLIITCAHVVNGMKVGDHIEVTLHSNGNAIVAQVETLREVEDVATLRLSTPSPEGVKSLLLGTTSGTSGHRFKTFGFPTTKSEEGIWGYGKVGDHTTENGSPVLQLTDSTEITQGFSGAPVLDTVTRRVIGIISKITQPDEFGRLTKTSFIIPTESLRQIVPEIEVKDICPYQGLAAFTEYEAEFFYGREKQTRSLLDKLRASPRFLAVVGPSGSGKSSVVKAGLVPALRRGEIGRAHV